jgi:hypothetical protein
MLRTVITTLICLFTASAALANAEVGKLAPDFTATDIEGTSQSLAAYRGKIVVLEWTNPGCPFVRKHYGPSNMQKLQGYALDKGVVWLRINSSAAGKQGNMTPEEAKQNTLDDKAKHTAYIQDPEGTIGKLYGAKTTPHMFVVNKEGILAYAGAIDDKPSFNPKDIEIAKNYVKEAMDSLLADKPVATASTPPYGCSVKYKD